MNIKDSLTQFSFNRLSDVEYVRLCRMGYFDHELEAVSKFFYDDVMREYNKRNAVYANIKGRVNIWKAPLQPKQVAFLEFFGFEGSEEDKATVTDAEARRMIAVIQFAIGNQRFIDAYPAWLKDSTESGFRDFTDADIAQMQKTLLKLQQKKKETTQPQKVAPDAKAMVAEYRTARKRSERDEEAIRTIAALHEDLKQIVEGLMAFGVTLGDLSEDITTAVLFGDSPEQHAVDEAVEYLRRWLQHHESKKAG